MSNGAEFFYRVKIALQLSFIIWVMIGILIFYATFEEESRMLGTFLLLFSVILFAPFLPDGTEHKEIENLDNCKEEPFENS